MNGAAAIEQGNKGYRFTATGLIFDQQLPRREWVAVGEKLAQIINGSTWALGDWVAYGAGRGDYGESYTTAGLLTGRSYDSLSQAARVSEAFPHNARTVRVPWSHYREALRLPDDDQIPMLQAAAEGRWSRDRFSQEIEQLLATLTSRPVRAVYQVSHHAPLGKPTASRQNRQVRCPHCGHRWTARERKGMLE